MKKTIILSALVFLGLTLLNAQSGTSEKAKVATGITKADVTGTTTMGSTHMDGMENKDGACCKGKDAKCEHHEKDCSKKECSKKKAKKDCCEKDKACCKKEETSACCKKGEAACKGHVDADHHHAD